MARTKQLFGCYVNGLSLHRFYTKGGVTLIAKDNGKTFFKKTMTKEDYDSLFDRHNDIYNQACSLFETLKDIGAVVR